MVEGKISKVNDLIKELQPSGSLIKGSAEKAVRENGRGSRFKALWVFAAVLAVALGMESVALGATGQSFSYDFANTGRIAFDGASSATFRNPTGAANLVATGTSSNFFQWGTGYNSAPNSLSFVGARLDGAFLEQPFSLGKLSYFNGSVLNGTEAFSVGLRTNLSFSGLSQSFDYGFQLINRSNTADPILSADSVLLSNSIPSSSFNLDGVDYTLKLAFGTVTGGGFSEVNQFFVLEGGSASAELIGSITANIPDTATPPTLSPPGTTPPGVTPGNPTPTVVPEPSTVLGGISAGGLILVFLLRRFRRDASAAAVA
ncbi:MAG TPA: choice-of-anchor K domain-containing protein [Terrimicrobiaceae bacterium]|nr:choice-of-anchor K domain-containing protein [Terrimicrobiaceae bacterium]